MVVPLPNLVGTSRPNKGFDRATKVQPPVASLYLIYPSASELVKLAPLCDLQDES
jgi:hypothetical protein